MKSFDYIRSVPTDKKKIFGNYKFPIFNENNTVFVDCGTSTGNLYKYINKHYKYYYGIEAAYVNYKNVYDNLINRETHFIFNKACYKNDN